MHHYWLWALGVVAFVGSLLGVPAMLVAVPENYFSDPENRHASDRHPVAAALLRASKNLLGLVLFAAGIVMLFTPGQGLLTILLGISLCDFPGKYRLERKIVGRPKVLGAINKLRAKFHRPPLLPPPPDPVVPEDVLP